MQWMFSYRRRILPVLILSLAAGGTLGGMASAGAGGDGQPSCEIRVSRGDGAIVLTALGGADRAIDGSYSFRVSGSGTNIRQGGSFRAAPGRPATLGTVTLGASGKGYDADLDIVVDGETISCSKRIGGGI